MSDYIQIFDFLKKIDESNTAKKSKFTIRTESFTSQKEIIDSKIDDFNNELSILNNKLAEIEPLIYNQNDTDSDDTDSDSDSDSDDTDSDDSTSNSDTDIQQLNNTNNNQVNDPIHPIHPIHPVEEDDALIEEYQELTERISKCISEIKILDDLKNDINIQLDKIKHNKKKYEKLYKKNIKGQRKNIIRMIYNRETESLFKPVCEPSTNYKTQDFILGIIEYYADDVVADFSDPTVIVKTILQAWNTILLSLDHDKTQMGIECRCPYEKDICCYLGTKARADTNCKVSHSLEKLNKLIKLFKENTIKLMEYLKNAGAVKTFIEGPGLYYFIAFIQLLTIFYSNKTTSGTYRKFYEFTMKLNEIMGADIFIWDCNPKTTPSCGRGYEQKDRSLIFSKHPDY